MGDREGLWNDSAISSLVSIGTHKLYAEIRGPTRSPSAPLVIIFPGSGAACESWNPVATQISSFARVFLYDRAGIGRSERGPDRDTGEVNARELSKLLKHIGVKGPYVLVAHSYGGCVAREFLQDHSREVVGMVLSETGTETQCRYAEKQYQQQILGDAPLSVVRGEAVLAGRSVKPSKRMEGAQDEESDVDDQGHHNMLQEMGRVDEMLKREQLKLSRNSKFRNVPDCGHSIHRDRPDVVVEELRWVLENILDAKSGKPETPSSVTQKSGFWTRLYHRVAPRSSTR